jgi:hypothetical protein
MPAKWDDSIYLTAYRMTQEGATDTQIRKAVGVSSTVWYKWRKKRPALAKALEAPPRTNNPLAALDQFIARRLPPALRQIWAEVNRAHKSKSPVEYIRSITEKAGTRGRQRLYLHALVLKRFNASEALSCVGLTKSEVDGWTRNDPDFAALIDEVRWHEDEFFAGALRNLVAEGNPAATIYAAKRRLGDRGFGEAPPAPVALHHHEHNTVDINDLGLTTDEKRALLERIRRPAVKQLAAGDVEVVDAVQ